MTRYLITGGAGFIGSNLVDYLLEEEKVNENDVRLLIPLWENLKNLEGRKLEIIVGDVRNKKDVAKAMHGIDIVYHLAASTGSDGGEYEDFVKTNLGGTANLIDESIKQNVKKFIFFSSIGVYGLPSTAGDMVNINELNTKNFSEGYGRTKAEAEEYLIKKCKASRMEYVIIRPSTVFGPKDKGGMAQMIKVISDKHFFRIGSGKNIMDYVYVKRLVSIARKLEKSKIKNDDFIVGSERPMSQFEMTKKVHKSMGVNFPKFYVPAGLAMLGSFITKYIFIFFGKKSPIFPNRVKVLTRSCYFDSSKVEKAIRAEVEKYNFDSGLKVTIDWMKNEKLIK